MLLSEMWPRAPRRVLVSAAKNGAIRFTGVIRTFGGAKRSVREGRFPGYGMRLRPSAW
jgi:hypothetical protein